MLQTSPGTCTNRPPPVRAPERPRTTQIHTDNPRYPPRESGGGRRHTRPPCRPCGRGRTGHVHYFSPRSDTTHLPLLRRRGSSERTQVPAGEESDGLRPSAPGRCKVAVATSSVPRLPHPPPPGLRTRDSRFGASTLRGLPLQSFRPAGGEGAGGGWERRGGGRRGGRGAASEGMEGVVVAGAAAPELGRSTFRGARGAQRPPTRPAGWPPPPPRRSAAAGAGRDPERPCGGPLVGGRVRPGEGKGARTTSGGPRASQAYGRDACYDRAPGPGPVLRRAGGHEGREAEARARRPRRRLRRGRRRRTRAARERPAAAARRGERTGREERKKGEGPLPPPPRSVRLGPRPAAPLLLLRLLLLFLLLSPLSTKGGGPTAARG